MTTASVNQIVERLAQPGPLTPERFAALLGAPVKPSDENPFWKFYTFELTEGPFARGELRLNTAGDAALLSLQPRDPPGMTKHDIDHSAWGPMRSLVPNPRIPPEGADTEVYEKDRVQISTQWTHRTRRLRSLVFEWAAPPSTAPAA